MPRMQQKQRPCLEAPEHHLNEGPLPAGAGRIKRDGGFTSASFFADIARAAI